MKTLSRPPKSNTNEDQSVSEVLHVDTCMDGEVIADEEEMLESSVHVTWSPGQSVHSHHVNLVEESDDTTCSPCPPDPDVSLTHYFQQYAYSLITL